jgi:hypothetical protein
MITPTNNSNSQILSSADTCGREVLNMGGSLTRYINTGNAGSLDSFEKNPKEDTTKNKRQFTHTVKNLLTAGLLGICAVVIGKNCSKNIKDIFEKAQSWLKNTPKTDLSEKAKHITETVSNSNVGKNAKETLEKVSQSGFITRIKNAFGNFMAKFKK